MNKTSVVAAILFSAVAVWAADPKPAVHPEELNVLAEIQGRIQSIDKEGPRVTLLDPGGQEVALLIKPETRVMDANNHQLEWTGLRKGDLLHAYYNTREKSAVQLDIVPSLTENVLGSEVSRTERKAGEEKSGL